MPLMYGLERVHLGEDCIRQRGGDKGRFLVYQTLMCRVGVEFPWRKEHLGDELLRRECFFV